MDAEETRDEIAFWDACCAAPAVVDPGCSLSTPEAEAAWCATVADAKLAERRKRMVYGRVDIPPKENDR